MAPLCKIDEYSELDSSSDEELFEHRSSGNDVTISCGSPKAAPKWKAKVIGSKVASVKTETEDLGTCYQNVVWYNIRVKTCEGGHDVCRHLHRRFSQFVKLHRDLQQEYKGNLPRRPTRVKLGNLFPTDKEFRQMRQTALQKYLEQIIEVFPDVRSSQALTSFLSVSEDSMPMP